MEKLHELHDEGGFDLIVVDTPPTRHALDFLDAPRRLTRLLDNRVFQLLMMPTRAYLQGRERRGAARSCARSRGRRVRGDRRRRRVLPRVRGHGGRVPPACARRRAAPRRAVDRVRARHLAPARRAGRGRLLRRAARRPRPGGRRADRQPRASRVRRRVARRSRARAAPSCALQQPADTAATERLAALYANLADFREIAIREREHLTELRESLRAATIAFVPYFARDVYDFEALHEVGKVLIGIARRTS